MNINEVRTHKVNNGPVNTRPEVIGRWELSYDEEYYGTLRAIVSNNPNFALGERVLQVFDDEAKRYMNVAFIQDTGSISMFKSKLDTEEHELVMEFQSALMGNSDYQVREVHRDRNRLDETAVGKAILGWNHTQSELG